MRIEEKFSNYFRDSISLGNDMWLVFERDQYHKGSKSDAVVVSLLDDHSDCKTRLATYFGGHWTSPNSRNADLFWSYVRSYKYQTYVQKMLARLTYPSRDLGSVVVEWRCLTRRFRIHSIKVSRKIKNVIL